MTMTKTLQAALVVALALAAGCGAKGASSKTPASGSDQPQILAKKVAVSWGITQGADSSDIFLATTDETGASVSHPVGTYPGKCKIIVPAVETHAVIAVACTYGGTGWELHAVVRGEDIIVLKMRTDQGVAPDLMAREEVTRVTAPPGAAIEATPVPNTP
jgi:hypothetical protein